VASIVRPGESRPTTGRRSADATICEDGAANSLKSPVSEAVCDNHPREVQTVFDPLLLDVGQFAHGSIVKLRMLRAQPNLSPDRERASKYGDMYFEV
jgi:hypothetical protein